MSQLVEIQNCQVSQLIEGKQDVKLSDGPLALLESTDGQLKLVCGTAAFSLDKSQAFYTHSASERIYIFEPASATSDSVKSYVKVLLPDTIIEVGSDAAQSRDRFESVLVERGFLKEGVAAMGDEYARGVNEAISAAAQEHVRTTDASDIGEFDQFTHNLADKAVQYSHIAAGYSQEFSKTVGNIAANAGQKISQFVQAQTADTPALQGETNPKLKETGEKLKSSASTAAAGISSVAAGIGAGLTNFYNTATAAAQDVIKNDFGNDTAKLSHQTGQTAENLGTVVAEGSMTTSAYYHLGKAGDGAVRGDAAKST